MNNKNIIERMCLKDEREFINIEGNYGAYQNWLFTEKLRTKFWADRSCGVVAAANTAYYLTRNHNKRLYTYKYIDIKSFTLFLKDITKYIRPRVYGIPTIHHMQRGFIRYAKSRGINLKAETLSMSLSNDFIIDFIKRALRQDYPVMMLTWNTKEVHLKYHWITITGYFKDIDGKNFIITSNWGDREVFNFDNWLNEKNFCKGLIYFK